MAVVLATAFFAHETITTDYTDYNKANEVYALSNQKNQDVKNKILESVKGTPIYNEYISTLEVAKIDYALVLEQYNKQKFLEFNSFQQFLGEFGWAFGLFMFSLISLIMTFKIKSETLVGRVVFFATPLAISIFFIRWCFKHEDFSKPTYIVANIITALALVYCAYIYAKWKGKVVEKLKEKIRVLIDFIVGLRPNINDIEVYDAQRIEVFKKIVD